MANPGSVSEEQLCGQSKEFVALKDELEQFQMQLEAAKANLNARILNSAAGLQVSRPFAGRRSSASRKTCVDAA